MTSAGTGRMDDVVGSIPPSPPHTSPNSTAMTSGGTLFSQRPLVNGHPRPVRLTCEDARRASFIITQLKASV